MQVQISSGDERKVQLNRQHLQDQADHEQYSFQASVEDEEEEKAEEEYEDERRDTRRAVSDEDDGWEEVCVQ